MKLRLTKNDLNNRLADWNKFLRRKIHLIACGGTALTLLDVKESTKDIDLMIPIDRDYTYLTSLLQDLGYTQSTSHGWTKKGEIFRFDLFRGNSIHTTQLIESPLEKKNNIKLKEFTYIYLGALNYYDLIISKIFRGHSQDFEDCLMLVKKAYQEIDLAYLKERFKLFQQNKNTLPESDYKKYNVRNQVKNISEYLDEIKL